MVTFPFIYLSAVFVAILLGHQERRHYLELTLEYELLGKPMPTPRPKIPKLESWLTILLGIFIFLFSLFLVVTIFMVLHKLPVDREQFTHIFTHMTFFSATGLATGFTMVILGIQSLQRNRQYEKNNIMQSTDKTNS